MFAKNMKEFFFSKAECKQKKGEKTFGLINFYFAKIKIENAIIFCALFLKIKFW